MRVNKEAQNIKTAKIGVHSTKTGKIWVKMGKVSSLRVQPSLRLLLKSYFCDFDC